jgi:UDP-GlcNAc:undecaprenyl-phosphate GlcNAc-1-phosphate transferase
MPWPPPEILALVVPFVAAVLLTALLRWLAPALGLMDRPDPRKVHTTPTPRAGGLAIFAALLLALPWLPPFFAELPILLVLLLAAVIVGLGLIDDLYPLPWWFRLTVQALVAWLVVKALPGPTPPIARFLAAFWLVAMINAFNMLDNMDALSAGTAWIIALGFLLLAVLRFGPYWGLGGRLELVLLGALAGFLVHNFPPARIFMGDSGSTLLGFLVGLFSLELIAMDRYPPRAFFAVLALCAVPIYDLTSVVLLRLSQGRSPFHPDKQHLSHRIADRGWSKPAAVAWIHVLGLASGASSVLIYYSPPETVLLPFLFLLVGWLSLAFAEFGPGRRRP